MSAPVLELTTISKAYGATQALDDVSLDVRAGEVHAVVGENGAGKSTLINIISGNLAPDSGGIVIDGKAANPRSAHAAQGLGIATVHQELSVVEHLSVAENIHAAHPPSRCGFVRWSAMADEARALFGTLGVSLDVTARVGSLPVSARQLVEIAKALSLKPRILLFDEPTSALNSDEKEALFRLIEQLRASGLAIIYISHHLEEVMRLADRVTVLRDGKRMGTYEARSITPTFLVGKMVGRDFAPVEDANSPVKASATVLRVEGLGKDHFYRDVSFTLAAGEIIGLAGLMGSGRNVLAASLAGLLHPERGRVIWLNQPLAPRSLRHAMKAGIAYVPGERKTEGLFLDLTVAENVVAATLPQVTRWGLFSRTQAVLKARGFISQLRIKTQDAAERCGALSGGNQQKVLLAKWLARRPRLLIIEEPTKGVDIAAKEEIHRMLRELASQGTAVLFVSSDLPEILSLAHRVLVMHGGVIVAERQAPETSEHEITTLASGLRSEAA
jgi:ABC-type sugar transport system ATPase subunit